MIEFNEAMLENSFRDYHVKGFDYVCLQRSPAYTKKVYFFDGISSEGFLPEVVCPHDHRYDFKTRVLAGRVVNIRYARGCAGTLYQKFRYDTPLNGGSGFTWVDAERLRIASQFVGYTGDSYHMLAEDIHTISVHADTTILLLEQFADREVEHTTTWTHSKEPINLSGLYNRFTADQLIKRIAQLNEVMP